MSRIALIPGDGIGVDVTREAVKVLGCVREEARIPLDLVEWDLGAQRYLDTGVTITPAEMKELGTGRGMSWGYTTGRTKWNCQHRLVVRPLLDQPRVTLLVATVGFGDSSIDFINRFWIQDPSKGLTNVRGSVYLAIWDTLNIATLGTVLSLFIAVPVAFLAALNNFFDPIQQLSQLYTTYQAGMAALDKIFELLDEEPDLGDRPGAGFGRGDLVGGDYCAGGGGGDLGAEALLRLPRPRGSGDPARARLEPS